MADKLLDVAREGAKHAYKLTKQALDFVWDPLTIICLVAMMQQTSMSAVSFMPHCLMPTVIMALFSMAAVRICSQLPSWFFRLTCHAR